MANAPDSLVYGSVILYLRIKGFLCNYALQLAKAKSPRFIVEGFLKFNLLLIAIMIRLVWTCFQNANILRLLIGENFKFNTNFTKV